MEPIKAFWCEPSGKIRRSFRCYQSRDADDPTCRGYCNAHLPLDVIDEERDADGMRISYSASGWPWDAFPTTCEKCGRVMTNPERQIFVERIYRRTDTGDTFSERELPVGAMRDCDWLNEIQGYVGADGIALEVTLPEGGWLVDSRAANCTLPDDKVHKCWVRHGDPRSGYVHVDKDGNTCAAGGGSIQQKSWHGFLHRGYVCEDRAVIDRMLDSRLVRLPVAERVLKAHQLDQSATPAPTGWRSNRGFARRKK